MRAMFAFFIKNFCAERDIVRWRARGIAIFGQRFLKCKKKQKLLPAPVSSANFDEQEPTSFKMINGSFAGRKLSRLCLCLCHCHCHCRGSSLEISQGCGDAEKAGNSSPTYPSFSSPTENIRKCQKSICIQIPVFS